MGENVVCLVCAPVLLSTLMAAICCTMLVAYVDSQDKIRKPRVHRGHILALASASDRVLRTPYSTQLWGDGQRWRGIIRNRSIIFELSI